ncbi:hypothetical protein EIP91_008917 [Steccherinum ochraceum]|uniref:Uncharacterized protein n=1 Tax=Steccherinum ochraceum TaxID=92696 RepID=A0A4R0RU67_9APHY|nr:hypothetical protein EIP91_008917 [Steccherinum ochraceum]
MHRNQWLPDLASYITRTLGSSDSRSSRAILSQTSAWSPRRSQAEPRPPPRASFAVASAFTRSSSGSTREACNEAVLKASELVRKLSKSPPTPTPLRCQSCDGRHYPRKPPFIPQDITMLSVMPQAAHLPLHVQEEPSKDVELNELGNLRDAVAPFVKLLSRSGPSTAVRDVLAWAWWMAKAKLRNIGIDLYDLQALRSRSLVFVHDLVEALRASGIAASYRLQPSSCPMCVVCALPPNIDASKVKAAATAAVENAHLELKERALLADLEDGLALVIT